MWYVIQMNVYEPDVGSVKIAEEIEHPSARKDAPVKLAQKCLLLWRVIQPLGCNVLSFSRVFTMKLDIFLIGLGRDGRGMLHVLVDADFFHLGVRHLDRQVQRGEARNEGMEQFPSHDAASRPPLYL
jgi:hypothetical protein